MKGWRLMAAMLDGAPNTEAEQTAERAAALALVRLGREQGLSLIDPDGLSKEFTKTVDRDLVERGDGRASGLRGPRPERRRGENIRNCLRSETVLTRRGAMPRSMCPAVERGRSNRRA